MLKLRVRRGRKTLKLKLERSPETVQALKDAIREEVARDLQQSHFDLSLNGKDALSGEASLKESGLRSGDLLHILQEGAASGPSTSKVDREVPDVLREVMHRFGFERAGVDKNRHTYSLSPGRRRGTKDTALLEVALNRMSSRYWSVHATSVSSSSSPQPTYSRVVRGGCGEVDEIGLLDGIVLPIVRDAFLCSGLDPPVLFDTANEDILGVILGHLGPRAAANLACVSKRWHRRIQGDPVFQRKFAEEKVKAEALARERRARSHHRPFEPHDDRGFPGRELFLGGFARF